MKKKKVLIVDDIKVNRDILNEVLSEKYDVIEGETGVDAVDLAMKHADELYLILLDIMMYEMDGFESLGILKSNPSTKNIPVIIITAAGSYTNELKGLNLGAADFISKPFNPDVIRKRVDSQISLKEYSMNMEALVDEKVRQLEAVQDTMVDFLANIVEYRDLESGQHTKRTRQFVKLLLDKLTVTGKLDPNCTPEDKYLITKAVTLHDVGKIGISDAILCKPGKLTPEEFEVIKKHTTIGFEILDNLKSIQNPKYLKHLEDICLYHHEKWDGSGYPYGLAGEEIPYSARLMSIIDVYDALIEKRVYKPAFTHEDAVKIIKEGSGGHFDPTLVEVFCEYNQEFFEKSKSIK